MKALSFENQNVVFAENQKEYQPLPAYAQDNGLVTFCMELDDSEIESIRKIKKIKLEVLIFGRPPQPIRVNVIEPKFPLTGREKFVCNPVAFEGQNATFEIELIPMQIQTLKKERKIWITTSTFGSPLQPISNILKD